MILVPSDASERICMSPDVDVHILKGPEFLVLAEPITSIRLVRLPSSRRVAESLLEPLPVAVV